MGWETHTQQVGADDKSWKDDTTVSLGNPERYQAQGKQ
jgi:hypothetical protein